MYNQTVLPVNLYLPTINTCEPDLNFYSFRMWTVKEISDISETLNREVKIEDFLTSEEIEAVHTSTNKIPQARILEPKHQKPVRLLNFSKSYNSFRIRQFVSSIFVTNLIFING